MIMIRINKSTPNFLRPVAMPGMSGAGGGKGGIQVWRRKPARSSRAR